MSTTVLIVDDEPTVRMLVTDVLSDLGYTAIEAADSAAGLKVLLVSGGFTDFTGPVADRLGFDEQRANVLLSDERGRLSGRVALPILGREAKVEALEARLRRRDLRVDDDAAVTIDMTLTSAACPLTDVIEDQTHTALDGIVNDVAINWVWMPPWGPDKITDDGREQLRALGFNV